VPNKLWIAALALAIAPAAAQTPLERGKYLVEGVLTCGNCHTPKGPQGELPGMELAGGVTFQEDAFTALSPNITPDPETGIGRWTAGQIKTAIRDGRRPSGQQLSPQMPYAYYKIFAPADLDAVVAYMRSLPPAPRQVEPPVYKAKKMTVDVPPGATKPLPEAAMKDAAKRGFYLVTIGHCMECHTPVVNGHRDFTDALGTGGERFEGPWGVSVSRNITSHKADGIGAWTDNEVKRAITKGVRKDGTKLRPPMGYDWYARMTDADLSAIIAYLRTLPAR